MDFFEQDLLPFDGGLKAALVPLTLNGHPQYIGRALQERNVGFREVALRTGVGLQNSEGRAFALQNDVHGPAYPETDEKLRRPEAFFVLQMVRDHGLARAQGKTGG